MLLYDFAVMGYDVKFSYRGHEYYLLNTGKGIISDSRFSEHKEVFANPMALVENFKIEGRTLLELAPEIDDIEPV